CEVAIRVGRGKAGDIKKPVAIVIPVDGLQKTTLFLLESFRSADIFMHLFSQMVTRHGHKCIGIPPKSGLCITNHPRRQHARPVNHDDKNVSTSQTQRKFQSRNRRYSRFISPVIAYVWSDLFGAFRSEERRVGPEGGGRW